MKSGLTSELKRGQMKRGPKAMPAGAPRLEEELRESYEADRGKAAIDFVERMRHFKGEKAGELFLLEEWQKRDIMVPLFGTIDELGFRQYRTVYCEVPRKNGKSTLAAAIADYLLVGDQEPGAEIYCVAADRGQARIVHDMAKVMIENSPYRDLVTMYRDLILYPETHSVLKVLSAEAYSKHGLNAHGVVFDEVHTQPNRELWDVMATSMGARRQPLMFAITTAGIYDPESLGWGLHEYAKRVATGVVEDPEFLPVLYGLEHGEDWTDPENWAKANPNLNVTISPKFLESEFRRAVDSPHAQNAFRRLYLNQWTQTVTAWLDLAVWDRNREVPDPPEGAVCYAGIDLGATQDLTAMVLVFPRPDGFFDVIPRFYIPEAKLKNHFDRVDYGAWARDGLIHVTAGEVTDYAYIRRDVNECSRRWQIREIAIDRWNATQLAVQLGEEDGANIFAFGQGMASMSAPSKDLERLLIDGRLRHGGHPVLRWNAANVAIREDSNGNIRPAKDRSSARIDGIVALIMGLDRAMANDFNRRSVYEGRGIRTL